MYQNNKRKDLNGRIQSITLFANSCQEMLVAAKQETSVLFLCSLPVKKWLDKSKKSIWKQNTVFLISPQQSLVSIFLTFYRNFLSNTDLMDCSPDNPCYLITTQKLSRHHFHYNQQNTWLWLLNHSEYFFF